MDLHYELRDAALRMENGAFLQEPELLISAAAEITTLRARIAELERERVELDARVAAMEPFMAMGAAHTPGAFGPACMDCGASMIGVERCQHCGGKH